MAPQLYDLQGNMMTWEELHRRCEAWYAERAAAEAAMRQEDQAREARTAYRERRLADERSPQP